MGKWSSCEITHRYGNCENRFDRIDRIEREKERMI